MAYSKIYSRINWVNESEGKITPLGAINMNKMDSFNESIDNRVVELDVVKANQSDFLSSLKDVSYNDTTGIFKFTWQNGATLEVDLNIEKIPVEFSMSEDGIVTLRTEDGTEYTADMKKLIKAYLFKDSDQIAFTTTTNADGSFEVTAIVKNGSILPDMLEPNLLAEMELLKQSAETSATSAKSSATEAKASEENAKQSETNAKDSELKAKTYAENASAVTSVEIATKDRAGIMKGGDNTVGEDGALMLTATTKESVMPNSNAGGAKINGIYGASEQKQYSGKNLIPYPYDTASGSTSYGVTYKVNEDKSISASGISNGLSVFGIQNRADSATPVVLQPGTYKLSGCASGGSGTTFGVRITTMDGVFITDDYGSGAEFTLTEETTIGITIMIRSGVTAPNGKFYPMIRLASIEDDTFEPYVGNAQSPSPIYPQPIEISEVSEIKTVGKNELLYPYYETTKTADGITWTDNGDGTVTANGTNSKDGQNIFSCRTRIETKEPLILKAGTYAINGCPSGGSISKYYIQVGRTLNGAYNGLAADYGNGSTFTLTEDTQIQVQPVVASLFSVNNLVFKPMIRRADIEDDTWEPYQSTKAQINFTGRSIEVTADDDYTYEKNGKYYIADSIERVENGYKKTQRIGEKIIDGVKNVCSYFSSNEISVVINLGTRELWADSQCNKQYMVMASHFRQKDYGTFEVGTMYQSVNSGIVAGYLSLDSGVTDIASANTWLQNNNVTVHYVLAEPVETMLTDEEAEALYGLKTFDGVTYISTDSEVEPIIEVEYGTSKVGGYALEGINLGNSSLKKSSVVDNLLSTVSDMPLSANQGRELKKLIDALIPSNAEIISNSRNIIINAYAAPYEAAKFVAKKSGIHIFNGYIQFSDENDIVRGVRVSNNRQSIPSNLLMNSTKGVYISLSFTVYLDVGETVTVFINSSTVVQNALVTLHVQY